VGRVVAIKRWRDSNLERLQNKVGNSGPSIAQSVGTATVEYFLPAIVLIAVPVVLGVCAVRDRCLDFELAEGKYEVTPDKNGNVFRHVVSLVGKQEVAIKDEFWTYAVGDCVALRYKPDMLVPALPGECDAS
jgi:hypothetical protein